MNHNIIYRPYIAEIVSDVMSTGSAFLGPIIQGPPGSLTSGHPHTSLFAALRSIKEEREVMYNGQPFAELYIPVFDSFNETERKVSGLMAAMLKWETYLRNVLPNSVVGVEVVIDYHCEGVKNAEADKVRTEEAFTYRLDGAAAHFVGYGDLHDGRYDEWMRHGSLVAANLNDGTVHGIPVHKNCSYDLHVYPTEDFSDNFNTATPIFVTVAIASVFTFAIFVFFIYDRLVEVRQKHVLTKATQSTAIVSSLFPKVRTRLCQSSR